MKQKFFGVAAVGLSLFLTPGAMAAFNADIVPADSRWMITLDFNALRESALGKTLIEMVPMADLSPESDPIRPNMDRILATIGTVTAFGTDFSGQPDAIDGTLVVQGSRELRTIAEGLMAQMSLMDSTQFFEVMDLPFEAWQVQGGLLVGFPEEPIIVASKSRERLAQAMDVFRRRAPSLAASNSPLLALLPDADAFYAAATTVVPTADNLPGGDRPEARILRMARAAAVALGERGDHTTAFIHLQADSAGTARNLVRIVDGVIAMFSLAQTNDERLVEFINSANVAQKGNAVSVELSYPTVQIVEMIANLRAQSASSGRGGWKPQPFEPPGRVLAIWTADQQLADDAVAPGNFVTKTIENVRLENGTTIVLSGLRHNGEHARFDFIELAPADGSGSPVRYEAEFMRLSGYGIESVPHASGGEVIRLHPDEGNARLRFVGASGVYNMQVRYVDETDGEASFAVSLLEPTGEPASD